MKINDLKPNLKKSNLKKSKKKSANLIICSFIIYFRLKMLENRINEMLQMNLNSSENRINEKFMQELNHIKSNRSLTKTSKKDKSITNI